MGHAKRAVKPGKGPQSRLRALSHVSTSAGGEQEAAAAQEARFHHSAALGRGHRRKEQKGPAPLKARVLLT